MTTPLCLAMDKIDDEEVLFDIVQLLLKYGANPNIHNKYSPTPLMSATMHDSLKIMRVLIDNGAKLEARDATGKTALFYARSKKCTKFFWEYGANISVKDKYGQTALFHSTEEKAEVLVNAGLDFNIMDKDGKTALFTANLEVTKLLLKLGSDPNMTDKHGLSPLFHYSYSRKIPIFKELINAGAILNKVYPKNRTPLIYAIENDKSDIIKLFIEMGADANLSDGFQLPLEVAMKRILRGWENIGITGNDRLEILKMLLRAGANPNIKDQYDENIWENINCRKLFDIFDEYVNFDKETRRRLLQRFR